MEKSWTSADIAARMGSVPTDCLQMKAAVRFQYGSPSDLRVQEMPKPVPEPDQVLVRVYATTVNRTDCAVLRGTPFIFRFFTGLRSPRYAITGTDFAGRVEAVGSRVTRFRPGDRVWGFRDEGQPTHAEFAALPEHGSIVHIPNGISYEQAAASAEGAHYAINFLKWAKAKAGDQVMVYGASGGIGSAAVQILKEVGATVTAVCNTRNLEAVRALGPDRVIDYEKEDFTLEKGRYDLVLDAVGKSSFGQCKGLLKAKGVYLSSELGPGNENLYLPLTTLFSGRRVKFPIPSNINGSLAYMNRLLEGGHFQPLIGRRYPLEQIAEAFHYVESGQKVGNVVLRLQEEES